MSKRFKGIVQAGLLVLALSEAPTAIAAPVQLVVNGGFETGTLGAWSTSGLGAGTCPTAPHDWNVQNNGSGASTGCNPVANPLGSTYAAYVMNDGNAAGLTYRLFQDIFIPLGTLSGTLSFWDTSDNVSDAGRTLSARFYTADGSTLLFQAFTESTFSGVLTWETHSVDVSSFLAANAGTTVQLEFDNTIPGVWTGAAGLGLDNVSLLAEVVTQVPEPTSIALAGLAFLGMAAARRRVKASS